MRKQNNFIQDQEQWWGEEKIKTVLFMSMFSKENYVNIII